MKRHLAAACLVFVTPLALAAPPSTDSVERLLTVTHTEQLLDNNMRNLDAAVRRSLAQSLQGQKLTVQGKQIVDAFAIKFVATVRDEITWDKVKPIYVRLYADTFSQKEIDGLLAFYTTPVGQSFIEKMPIVSAKSTAAMQELMDPIVLRMRESIKEASARAKSAR